MGDSGNDHPNGNGSNAKLKSLYNGVKASWMLKYGTKRFLPRRMNSTWVEVWYAFKLPAGNIIREIFVKTKLLPLSPPNFSTNTHTCVASIQVSSGTKSEDINATAHQSTKHIKVQEIRTYNPMVVLLAKGVQQPSRNLILQAAA